MQQFIRPLTGVCICVAVLAAHPTNPSFAEVAAAQESLNGDAVLDAFSALLDPGADEAASGETNTEEGRAPSDQDAPPTLQERFDTFIAEITALYDAIVEQLGPPRPETESAPEAGEHMDPRVERVSRGFFSDMKEFFGERDSEDPDPDYQRERLRGMSERIDQQFHDVAELLQEFEEERYGERSSSR